jgi:hypothetical protein
MIHILMVILLIVPTTSFAQIISDQYNQKPVRKKSIYVILLIAQVNNQEDGNTVVVPIEKQIKLTHLSAWGKPYTAPAGIFDSTLSKKSPNEQFYWPAEQFLSGNRTPPPL